MFEQVRVNTALTHWQHTGGLTRYLPDRSTRLQHRRRSLFCLLGFWKSGRPRALSCHQPLTRALAGARARQKLY
jgi:hypothetical protein